MSESNDVQALEKISSEVDESQVKIILTSQCIKAQAFLVDKLRKQTERQKEICKFISSNNLMLTAEIKLAEQETKSLLLAHDTIKAANVELKKEYLLAKERKEEIVERAKNGQKKYETLWLESKNRYESIPFVQAWLQVSKNNEVLTENISVLQSEAKSLKNEITIKREYIQNLDRKRILEFAKYYIHELPVHKKNIREKSILINDFKLEIESILKEQEVSVNEIAEIISTTEKNNATEKICSSSADDDSWPNLSTLDSLTMPKLQLKNIDLNILSVKLNQIKKVDELNTAFMKRTDSVTLEPDFANKRFKSQDRNEKKVSQFSKSKDFADTECKSENYSKRKLINILDDVTLDKNNTYAIVSNVNTETLKAVSSIGGERENNFIEPTTEPKEIVKSGSIVEQDMAINAAVLNPPTQFLDLSQEKYISKTQKVVDVVVHKVDETTTELSQTKKNLTKKKVSFEMPMSLQLSNESVNDNKPVNANDNKTQEPDKIDGNESILSQLNMSSTSDESFMNIKEMILKKHNLDLSPQFVYAKNIPMQKNSEKIITSKFFKDTTNYVADENRSETENSILMAVEGPKIVEINYEVSTNEINRKSDQNMDEDIEELNISEMAASSPKNDQAFMTENPVSGFLFSHGAQGIPDSLNVSINTTGCDDGDGDFPHCIDSSLLLSPKQNLSMPTGTENADVSSQEVPNFLLGLRKTGFSIFGMSSAQNQPDTNSQNPTNNFSFNFGGEEKKNRGGLFSMFH